MRHTVHLLLGSTLKPVAESLKDYVLKYGEGDVKDYLQIIGWDSNRTDDEVARFFSKLYTETLTINREGESHVMHLCIEVFLYDDADVTEALRIVQTLDLLSQQYKVDILGLSADMAPVFGVEEEPHFLQREKANCQRLTAIRTALSRPEVMHRFLLMQNRNTDGVSLCLDHQAFIRIAGELAMACTENYDTLFPLAEESEEADVTAFGLSALIFDKHYFADYLLRRAFLSVLDRERVTDTAVDVNRATAVAQDCLRGKTHLLTDFYAQEITPLLRQGKRHEDIASVVAGRLDERIGTLIGELQSFVGSKDYSLPEKQAIIAQMLGLDDPLITGYQFAEQALTLDDCSLEPLTYFVDEVNRLGKAKYEDDDFDRIFGEQSGLPRDSNGRLVIPTDEMKSLRESISQSNTYLREKTKEMADIERQTDRMAMGGRRQEDNTRLTAIRNQVAEERKTLRERNEQYAEKRNAYENMMQTLCKPAVRRVVQRGAEFRLKKAIDHLQARYDQKLEQRTDFLGEFDKETRKSVMSYIIGEVFFGFTLLFCLYQRYIWGDWVYYTVGSLLFYTAALVFYPSYRRNKRNRTEEALEEEMTEVLQEQADTEQRLKTNALRTHVAGMLLDAFAQLSSSMTNRYLVLRSHVGRLSQWRTEEAARLGRMESQSRDPFLLLLNNHALDDYFDKHCEELTDGLWLYEGMEGSDTSEEALAAFRTRMEERIRERIMSVAADFNVYDYITCSRDFPYLNRQYCDVATLLPLLDSKSKPFLHYTVKDMRHKQPMQRYIFIHTDSPEEQAKWRDTYPRFFQMKPSAAETVSCFKLVVIQKQDIRKEDRV